MRSAAVIFDLDGTLLDTLEDLADSMNAVLEGLGYPTHPVDAYRLFVGDGVATLAARALPSGDRAPEIIERCVRGMREEYGSRWRRTTAPYPGIRELLGELADRGIAMAVLSNKPHEHAREVVAHFFAEGVFHPVLGARDGVPRKPDPTAALEILRSLGVPASEALYVGDSGTDMDTARAAGLESVGVLWGFRSREELLQHGADHLASRPSEIAELARSQHSA